MYYYCFQTLLLNISVYFKGSHYYSSNNAKIQQRHYFETNKDFDCWVKIDVNDAMNGISGTFKRADVSGFNLNSPQE